PAISEVDIRTVRLIAPPDVAVYRDIQMAIVVHIADGQRLGCVLRRPERRRAAGEAPAPVAVIDVDSPSLEGGNQVEMTVVIQVSDNQVAPRHGLARLPFRKCGLQAPVSRVVTEIDLDAGLLKSHKDQLEVAVAVQVGELRSDVP